MGRPAGRAVPPGPTGRPLAEGGVRAIFCGPDKAAAVLDAARDGQGYYGNDKATRETIEPRR